MNEDKKPRTRYRTTNWPQYNAALKARGALSKRFGWRLWKIWSGYHRRSLVETKMHCFKRLGERVMARTFERQVVELHIRVAKIGPTCPAPIKKGALRRPVWVEKRGAARPRPPQPL